MLRHLLLALFALPLMAADVVALVDKHASTYAEASQAIWRYAELGYQEHKSAALLQRHLREAGFTVEAESPAFQRLSSPAGAKGNPSSAFLPNTMRFRDFRSS